MLSNEHSVGEPALLQASIAAFLHRAWDLFHGETAGTRKESSGAHWDRLRTHAAPDMQTCCGSFLSEFRDLLWNVANVRMLGRLQEQTPMTRALYVAMIHQWGEILIYDQKWDWIWVDAEDRLSPHRLQKNAPAGSEWR